jgi:ABC-type Fe3+ transport system substrate-binding protein
MKNIRLIAAFALVLLGPLALRPKQESHERAAQTLVIISPHNLAIRYEFARAFDEYYFKRHGGHVHVDWRSPGGTSEIARYLASEYLATFQNHWTHDLGRLWSADVQTAFDNPKAPPDDSPGGQARGEFLASRAGCGIDLFFGGGSFDFIQQANAGRLVDCGVIAAHPELFNDKAIPQTLCGEPYWDPKGRWIGACLSSFGICYNTDLLKVLGIEQPPRQWSDLADPRYFGEIALADPNQSGSVGKAFEMLIQQQMLMETLKISELQVVGAPPSPQVKQETDAAVAKGWTNAMRLIQKISASSRYFTDSAPKVPFDVEEGNAAAGMCIDFYGRFQSEFVRKPDGSSRMQYITPEGGSSVGVDPIGLLRGAPHAELAREFIEFAMSPEGQKLWDWKVGAPGGPTKYALRRLPILPTLYEAQYDPFRSDRGVNPYEQAGAFVYHPEWTAPLFRVISFNIRVMCIDTHDELRDAWQALIATHFPPQAMAVFDDVSKVDYAAASGRIRKALASPVEELKLAKELDESFAAQYRRAAELARERK